jgi:ABC-type glycerol-3-phosphate transport system substrate-binding protein
MKPGLRGLVAVAAVAVAASGCRRAQCVLTIATYEGERIPFEEMQTMFPKGAPCAFDVRELDYDTLHQEVLQSLDRKTPGSFDVVMVDDPWLSSFRNTAAKLRPLALDLSAFVPETLEPVKVASAGPTRYDGVPYVANSQLLCYNTAVFHGKPPGSWKELLVAAARVQGAHGYAMRASDDVSSVTDEFMPVYWASAGDARAALEIMGALTGLNPPSFLQFGSLEIGSLLLKRRAAMGIIWSSMAMKMHLEGKKMGTSELSFAQVPGFSPEFGVWFLSVAGNAPHPEAAEDFVRRLTSREALERAAGRGNPPARRDLLESQLFPSFAAQLESLRTARSRPRCKDWKGVEETIGLELRRMYVGATAPEAAAEKISSALCDCETEAARR